MVSRSPTLIPMLRSKPNPFALSLMALLCCGFQQNENVSALPTPACDAIQEWALTTDEKQGTIINITYQRHENDYLIPRPAKFWRNCGAECERTENFSNFVRLVSPMSHYLWLPELMIGASRCFSSETPTITRHDDGRFSTINSTVTVGDTQLEFTWAEDTCGFGQTDEVAGYNGCGSIRASHLERGED
jgi:hypothetical protein